MRLYLHTVVVTAVSQESDPAKVAECIEDMIGDGLADDAPLAVEANPVDPVRGVRFATVPDMPSSENDPKDTRYHAWMNDHVWPLIKVGDDA